MEIPKFSKIHNRFRLNGYFYETINKNTGYTTKRGKMTSNPTEGSEISKKIDSV